MSLSSIFVSLTVLTTFLTGCARDLSTNVYHSQSTLSLTLEGTVISARPITVREADRLDDQTGGMLAGGVAGGVAGSTLGGHSNDAAVAAVGGALVGAAIGAITQDRLSNKAGYEYIIKVDTSKLKAAYYEGNAAMRNAISSATTSGVITVIQGTNEVMQKGQHVYVIFSDDRTRVIPVQ